MVLTLSCLRLFIGIDGEIEVLKLKGQFALKIFGITAIRRDFKVYRNESKELVLGIEGKKNSQLKVIGAEKDSLRGATNEKLPPFGGIKLEYLAVGYEIGIANAFTIAMATAFTETVLTCLLRSLENKTGAVIEKNGGGNFWSEKLIIAFRGIISFRIANIIYDLIIKKRGKKQ